MKFSRTPWMIAEVRRIAQARFPAQYWASIEDALLNCLESHSVVQVNPNDDKQIAAFVLVCPPTTSSRHAYGVKDCLPANIVEIAFVATDVGWEGRGYARDLLEAVLSKCQTLRQPAWLHVDTTNEKAHAFYERLGFRNFLHIPDPFGSPGVLMTYSPPSRSMPRGNQEALYGPTLFNTTPSEAEQTLRRSVLAPPGLACC